MKRASRALVFFLSLSVLALCLSGFSGCGKGDVHVAVAAQDSSQVKFFQGEHELLPFISDSDCGYLSFNGVSYTFYWRNDYTGSDFVAGFLPYEVSFVTDESRSAPVCQFRWKQNARFEECNWRTDVTRVFITGKAEHIHVPPQGPPSPFHGML